MQNKIVIITDSPSDVVLIENLMRESFRNERIIVKDHIIITSLTETFKNFFTGLDHPRVVILGPKWLKDIGVKSETGIRNEIDSFLIHVPNDGKTLILATMDGIKNGSESTNLFKNTLSVLRFFKRNRKGFHRFLKTSNLCKTVRNFYVKEIESTKEKPAEKVHSHLA